MLDNNDEGYVNPFKPNELQGEEERLFPPPKEEKKEPVEDNQDPFSYEPQYVKGGKDSSFSNEFEDLDKSEF
jgi:hypothetical protein